MKKLIALMLVASLTGAVIAQQSAPQQAAPAARTAQAGPANKMDDKDKKHHRHHHRHHHPKPGEPAAK